MIIRNAREYALEIAATGQVVESGADVEVDDDLGDLLIEQPDNWASTAPGAAKKSDPTTPAASGSKES